MDSSAADRNPTVAALAAPLLDNLPALTDRLVALIHAEEAAYRGADPRLLADLRRSCQDNLADVLRDLTGLAPLSDAPPRDTARRRAEQGVPLASVLHAYRLGLRVIWEAMLAERRDLPENLAHVVTRMWTILDLFSQTVADVYEETLIELTRRDERRRALILDNLIDGRPPYGEFAGKLASAVGLPDKGRFVAVSAEVPAAGSEGLPRADHVLRRHGIRSTWRLRVDEQVGVIALDEPLAVIKELLGSVALCRAGLSPEYPDLRDTAANVALASLARRCLPPGDAGIATLDAHPLSVLVAGAPEMATFVAQEVFGTVLALEPEERETLLETFAAWVAADGSASAAARELSCHRNTVRNRLQRLTDLTGRSVTDPRSLVELCAGAEAIRLLDLGTAQ